MKRYPPAIRAFPHMIHGADYNPEQWLKWKDEIWQEDIRLAKQAGMNSLSVGIFAWSMLEPEEGEFHFEWLDEVMDLLAENGMKAILATPTAARPNWLAEKYPEVLRMNDQRVRNLFGGRHNHCMSSPAYREKARIINTKLAERYKDHPALGMWHVSNEVSGDCHCPLCQQNFRLWLKEKYGSLDAINEKWWTTFWSHRYTKWEQIESPTRNWMGERDVHGLRLDWLRFTTDQHISFYRAETAPLREITPDVPCTANLMADCEELDYYAYAKELDIVSWDNYPCWRGDEKGDVPIAIHAAFCHDLMYGLKRRPWFLMESSPSCTNWQPVAKLHRPGNLLRQSMQAVAHGSDSVQYFQFRKSRGSSEKFHGAVVSHEGTEKTRVYKDVCSVGETLKTLDDVVGTVKDGKVALLFDYHNNWALQDMRGALQERTAYRAEIEKHYAVLWKKHVPVEIIDQTCDLSAYKCVFAPMSYMLRGDFAKRVEEYVEQGGTFVTTYLTGYVDDTDLCFRHGFPGPLRKTLGIWAEELDSLYPEDENSIEWNGQSYRAHSLCELIHPETAKALGQYGSDFYAGMAALTENVLGKGKAYYIAARTDEDFLSDFYQTVLDECGVSGVLKDQPFNGVSAQRRTDGETEYVFLMNFADTEKQITVDGESITLSPREVKLHTR